MQAQEYLKDCKLKLWEESISVLKLRSMSSDFIAVINSPGEITAIANTGTTPEGLILEEEKGWRAISFEVVLPFELVGFLAAVTKVLAEAGVSIFALSAYSTDHILVKEEQLEVALKQLMGLGCVL